MIIKTFPILYKRSATGSPQQWQIFAEGNSYRTEAGQVGGVITGSLPSYCKGKNIGKANATTDEEQAYAEAASKHKKKLDSGYFENLESIDNETFFKPMLAKKYFEEKHKIDWKTGVFVQSKTDGVRAIITKDGATTRTGLKHVAIPHILKALAPVFEKYPDTILDGELYNHQFRDNFNKLVSLVRKTKPTKEDLEESEKYVQFYCYDAPVIFDYGQSAPFTVRYDSYMKLLGELNHPYIKIVPCVKVYSDADVIKQHIELVSNGYEGAIIRIPNGVYSNKRSDKLLKLKHFDTDEYIIHGVVEGEGNKAGMAGTIHSYTKEGRPFDPNIKAPHSVLIDLWKQRESLIGRTCTVRYFGLTPDDLIPRFPYVIDIDRWKFE